MCRDNHDELMKSREFYKTTLVKLSDDRIFKEEGSTDQIEILERIPELEKFISENTLKLKSYQLA
jgi:hypothetical protein